MRETISSGCNGFVSSISKSSATCTGNSDWKPDRFLWSSKEVEGEAKVASSYQTVEWNQQVGQASPRGHRTLVAGPWPSKTQPNSLLTVLGALDGPCWGCNDTKETRLSQKSPLGHESKSPRVSNSTWPKKHPTWGHTYHCGDKTE